MPHPNSDLVTYERLCELLKAFRTDHRFTRPKMAVKLGADVARYSDWERGDTRPMEPMLRTIAETLLVPMEALLRLHAGYPILFDTYTRRYSTDPFDPDFVNRKVLQKELLATDYKGSVRRMEDGDLEQFFRLRKKLYPGRFALDEETLFKAVELSDPLSLVAEDPRGFYAGHMITVPVEPEIAKALQSGVLHEADLTEKGVVDIDTPDLVGGLHVHSFFATRTLYAYCLVKRFVTSVTPFLSKAVENDWIITRMSVTYEGNELSRKMDLRRRRFASRPEVDEDELQTDPVIWSRRIGDLGWLLDYAAYLGTPAIAKQVGGREDVGTTG